MRITLLVLNHFVHDARVHKEASSLVRAGHEVLVVALWRPGLLEDEAASAGYQVRRIRLAMGGWRGRLLAPLAKYLEFCWRIWRLAGTRPADIWHANDANTLPAAWLAARRNRAKLVYDSHELETGRNFRSNRLAGVYRWIWAWPEKLFIRRADAVITASDGYTRELARSYRLPQVTSVLNCPETCPVAPNNRMRRELQIPDGQKILLYQGRVARGRGLEPVFAAVQTLPEACVVVLGDGPQLAEYRAAVRGGRWARVHLPGLIPLADLPEYTVGADLGLVLIQGHCRSYQLTMPNKLFEYFHAGLPVLGSDLPEIGRVIREQDVGAAVDPDDPAAIAAAARRLLDDPQRLCELRANARRAASVYNWETESAKLLAVYQDLMGKSPSAKSEIPDKKPEL